ncbi:MAG: hypothetical protein H0U44_11230 [Flavisolibacter sp.]|nr:hypothetical protein [Flavisolibacter sp.]
MKNTPQAITRIVSLFFVGILVLGFTSCKKADLVQEETISEEKITALSSFIAMSTGVKDAKITYDRQAKTFAVDKDGRISLADAELRFNNYQPGGTQANGTQQRSYMYTLTRTSASLINIYVEPSVPADWVAAIDQSISNWNSTISLVTMKRVTATTTTTTTGGKGKKNTGSTTTTTTTLPSYHIKVTSYYDASTSTVAWAYLPSFSGNVGPEVSINTKYNYLNAAYKTFTMTHEFGHSIGFTHTDGSYGNLVPGTPEVDPNSVMNSFILPWQAFTNFDILAVRTLYPR